MKALHYFGRQGLVLRGKDDDGNPTNEDVTNKENFKELFNIICGSNDRLRKLFEKRKKNATLISKTIQNELLSCVQKYILECIIKEINEEETPYFGVIADEVTDCANWKLLEIVIFYVYQQKPVERVTEYVKWNNIRGENIANLIIESRKSNGIDISYCRSQTYDGAGNMAEKQDEAARNSPQKILRMIKHYIIIVPLTN